MKKSYEIDMCNGPLLSKILLFSVPLMMSGILQLLFNAADIIVVGRFAGSSALAAVGSTSSLINLLINVFVGLSVGVNVLVAKYYGGQREKDMSETVHTAVLTSLLSGLFLVILGGVAARPLLHLMGTPDDVLDQAVLYMRIYFLGMPVLMVYNFGAAILRAIGDTRRPLYFLFMAGVVNVALNLFFVIGLGMGVDGVGWATVISEHVSALLVLKSLMEAPGALKLNLRELRIYPKKLKRIVKIGLPAGMQGAIFSISNVLIQSSVNSFGSIAMAGNTASANIEGFVYTAMNAVYQTNLSFTSQNLGGRKYSRINRIMYICLAVVTIVGITLGITAVLAGDLLLGIYSSDAQVLHYGMLRLEIICGTYFLCGIMDCMVGSLRGLGYSIIPMFVSLTGACGFRVLWVFTVFAAYRSLDVLYLSYPVSWAITAVAHMITFRKIRRKIPRQDSMPLA
ncbi:MATE family efflux transporter [Enterocloster sp. OA13]|uniref:MATE family efflux transporter n=1 Tax=Enterocloster hominis (ex Hitch et al. 2024) TaxID=1917870 RepID=A0ABV1D6S9_9FIRM|nr:MATE efflux family protein [Clostridiales bacterium 1_7_47FAA]MCH1950777.1 MATE family efflux transporter [Enterocloster sp. OA13]RJW43142.1 MATE family efflux transporter [Clostridiales bacterium TF09-2AC]